MAVFSYSAWSNCEPAELIEKLEYIFSQRGFSLPHPLRKMCQVWDEEGNYSYCDPASLCTLTSEDLPFSVQWWRGDDNDYNSILVTLKSEKGGIVCLVYLSGLKRSEEAELGRLLIEHIVPPKWDFPDDYAVFTLTAW